VHPSTNAQPIDFSLLDEDDITATIAAVSARARLFFTGKLEL